MNEQANELLSPKAVNEPSPFLRSPAKFLLCIWACLVGILHTRCVSRWLPWWLFLSSPPPLLLLWTLSVPAPAPAWVLFLSPSGQLLLVPPPGSLS